MHIVPANEYMVLVGWRSQAVLLRHLEGAQELRVAAICLEYPARCSPDGRMYRRKASLLHLPSE